MTRPLRNRLLAAVFVFAAFFAAPRLGDGAMWALTSLAVPMLVLAFWVTWPFHRARGMFAKKQYDSAATELAAFESSMAQVPWKRFFAGLAVGFFTTNAVAAARNTLGAVRLEQQRLEDAETHFKAALQLDPGYAVPWGNLAVLAAMRGDAGGAEEARLRAAALGFKPKLLAAVIHDKLKSRSESRT
jgi:tetratricopeptide (TPR) repeat protein